MCGLVGYFGEWSHNRELAFLDMLRMGVVRGNHSTGVGFLGVNGATKTHKDSVLPDTLIGSSEFKKISQKMWNGYLGHNRFATTGKINKENSHPFIHGFVIGAHNGTIINQTLLPEWQKFDVDSDNIIYSINKIGAADTWKILNGPSALSWWDNKSRTLNLLRNKDRLLFFAKTLDGTGVFWASEDWMISAAVARNEVEVASLYFLPENVLYSYSLQSVKGKENIPILSLVETKMEEYKPPFIPIYKSYFETGRGYSYDDSLMGYNGWYGGSYKKQQLDTIKDIEIKHQPVDLKKFKSGKCAVIPEKIIRTFDNQNNIVNIKLICSLRGDTDRKVKINLTEPEAALYSKFIPGEYSVFSEALFIVQVNSVTVFNKLKNTNLLLGEASSIKIVLPNGAYRTMINGAKLTREQFDNADADCVFCEALLNFEDPDIEEDSEGPNVLCGKCANESKQDKLGYSCDELFRMARSN